MSHDADKKRTLLKLFRHLIVVESPGYIEFVLRILGEIQIILLLGQLNTQNKFDQTGTNLQEFSVLMIDFSFKSAIETMGLEFWAIAISLYEVGILSALLFNFKFENKNTGKFENSSYNLLIIHLSIISYYINITLLQQAVDKINQSNALAAPMIILIIFNIIIGLLGSYFACNILRNSNICALRTRGYFFTGWIYKIFDIFIRVTNFGTSELWIRVLFGGSFLIIRTLLLKGYPFYHFDTQKIFFMIHGIQLGFLTGGITQLFYSFESEYSNFTIYLSIVLAVILGYSFWSVQELVLINSASKPIEKINKVEEFELKLNITEYLFRSNHSINLNKGFAMNNLLSTSIMKQNANLLPHHQTKDGIIEIFTTSIRGYSIFMDRFSEKICAQIYKIYLVKHPKNLYIQLSYLFNQIKTKPNQSSSSIIQLAKLASNKSDFFISTLASKLLQKIFSGQFERIKYEQKADIQLVANYIKASLNLKRSIKEGFQNYLNFWSENRWKTSMIDLFSKATRIEKFTKQLEENWAFLRDHFPNGIQKETFAYSIYLKLVRNRPLSSAKIMKSKKNSGIVNRLSESSIGKFLENDNPIFVMLERQNDGREKITDVNEGIEIFGYSCDEIKARGFEILLPQNYFGLSKFSLMEYIEQNFNSIFGQKFKIYLKNNKDIICLMNCYFSVLESRSTLSYLLMLDFDESNDFAIILNKEGHIANWSQGLEDLLKISSNLNEMQKVLELESLFDVKCQINDPNKEHNNILEGSSTIKRFDLKTQTFSKIQILKHEFLNGGTFELSSKTDPSLHFIASGDNAISISSHMLYKLVRVYDFFNEMDIDLIPDEKVPLNKKIGSRVFSQTNNHTSYTAFSEKKDSSTSVLKNELLSKKHKNQTSSSQSSHFLKIEQFEKEVEQKLYFPKEDFSLLIINGAVFLFIILAIILSIFYMTTSLNRIDKVPIVTQTSIYLNSRHQVLWPWIYFDAINLKLLLDGFFSDQQDRQGYTLEEYFQETHRVWPELNERLASLDNQIIDTIPYFEENIRPEFYTQIKIKPVYDEDQYQNGTLFFLDRMIMDCGIRMNYLETMTMADQDPNDPRFMFIVNNVLDDQFVMEEYLYVVLKLDVDQKLNKIKTFGEAICIFLLAYGLILFAFIMFKASYLMIQRLTFAEAINKITDHDLDSHLKRVSNFLNNFDNFQNMGELYKKMGKVSTRRLPELKIDHRAKATNGSKYKYLNIKIAILVLLILTMEALVIIVSYINLLLTIQNQDVIERSLRNSIKAAILMNDMITLATGMYSYTLFNQNVTIKNRPFNEIWDKSLQNWATSQEFYTSLLYQTDPDLAEILITHYTQNLCELITDGICYEPAIPVLRNGDFGLYAFLIKVTTNLKAEIDSSQKTFEDYKRILYLDDFVLLEFVAYMFPQETQVLMNVLQTQVERSVEKFKTAMKISVSCFVVGFVIFLVFIWKPIKKSLKEQQSEITDTLKLVPSGVIKQNISMKAFWTRFSN